MSRNRKPIPGYVKAELKRRQLGLCAKCIFPLGSIYHVHHDVPYSEGGTDNLDNLELVCPNCHMKIHTQRNLENYKSDREKKMVIPPLGF